MTESSAEEITISDYFPDHLTPAQRLLLLVMRSAVNEEGVTELSMRVITRMCGWKGRASTRRNLAALKEAGLVTVHPADPNIDPNGTNSYTFSF